MLNWSGPEVEDGFVLFCVPWMGVSRDTDTDMPFPKYQINFCKKELDAIVPVGVITEEIYIHR